jgi:hypothetical protein
MKNAEAVAAALLEASVPGRYLVVILFIGPRSHSVCSQECTGLSPYSEIRSWLVLWCWLQTRSEILETSHRGYGQTTVWSH